PAGAAGAAAAPSRALTSHRGARHSTSHLRSERPGRSRPGVYPMPTVGCSVAPILLMFCRAVPARKRPVAVFRLQRDAGLREQRWPNDPLEASLPLDHQELVVHLAPVLP